MRVFVVIHEPKQARDDGLFNWVPTLPGAQEILDSDRSRINKARMETHHIVGASAEVTSAKTATAEISAAIWHYSADQIGQFTWDTVMECLVVRT